MTYGFEPDDFQSILELTKTYQGKWMGLVVRAADSMRESQRKEFIGKLHLSLDQQDEFLQERAHLYQEKRKGPDELRPLFGQLNQAASFDEIKKLLGEILEPEMNQENCFWLSHAWAESLIRGRTISVKNFPFNAIMDVRYEPKVIGRPDQGLGAHLSYGAESLFFRQRTAGINQSIPERSYQNIGRAESWEELHSVLDELESGQMVLLAEDTENSQINHATLAANINGQVVMIGNFAFHPGPVVQNREEFISERTNTKGPLTGEKGYYVYLYPEKMYGFSSNEELEGQRVTAEQLVEKVRAVMLGQG